MIQKFSGAAFGVLLGAPLVALAQQTLPVPDPADPNAAVRPIVYESAFARPAQPAQDAQPTPDKVWRAANDSLAAPSGHAGHGMPQADQSGDKDAAAAAAPVRAATSGSPRPQPAPVDHSKHH
jgi:hypothetical protein